jgi:hypothetical protein
MENVLGFVVMVAIAFPLSFFLARGCLRGVIRLVTGPVTGSTHRNVL